MSDGPRSKRIWGLLQGERRVVDRSVPIARKGGERPP
jgi:hypothetical protein